MFQLFTDFLSHRVKGVGPDDGSQGNALPVGLCRFSCNDFVGIAFLDHSSETILSMFTLDPGKQHVVRVPDNVSVVIECGDDVEWFVSYSNRFNKSDPTRVDGELLRPRSQQEEMQDYLNEVAARAAGKEMADKLRSGQVEFDMTGEDYSEVYEDDEIAPLSVYQMEEILNVIQSDIEAARQSKQRDIEEEAPLVPLKTGAESADNKAAPAASKDSKSKVRIAEKEPDEE